jgi:hypothetical protein
MSLRKDTVDEAISKTIMGIAPSVPSGTGFAQLAPLIH